MNDEIPQPPRPAGGWQNRIIGHGNMNPDQLLANPMNARVHPRAQSNAVVTLLETVGWLTGVIVNQRTDFIVDGHLRVAEAIAAGEPSVPVTYVDISDEDERLVLAFYDATTNMAILEVPTFKDLIDPLVLADPLQKLADDMLGTPPPDDDAPEEEGDLPESDISWGYATFGKRKVGCSIAEVDGIHEMWERYKAGNDGDDAGFVRSLVEAAREGGLG